jgi:hypothetical protein
MKGPRISREGILGDLLRLVNVTEPEENLKKPVRDNGEQRFFAFLEIRFGVSKK